MARKTEWVWVEKVGFMVYYARYYQYITPNSLRRTSHDTHIECKIRSILYRHILQRCLWLFEISSAPLLHATIPKHITVGCSDTQTHKIDSYRCHSVEIPLHFSFYWAVPGFGWLAGWLFAIVARIHVFSAHSFSFEARFLHY